MKFTFALMAAVAVNKYDHMSDDELLAQLTTNLSLYTQVLIVYIGFLVIIHQRKAPAVGRAGWVHGEVVAAIGLLLILHEVVVEVDFVP